MATYDLDRSTVQDNLLASVGQDLAQQILLTIDSMSPSSEKLTLFENFKAGDVVPPNVQLLVIDPVVSGQISVVPSGPAAVVFSGTTGVQVVLEGVSQQFVKLGQGSDVVTLREGASGQIVDLGPGNDVFVGNTGNNTVVVGQGSDKVDLKGGNDTVVLSGGSAEVDGGTGFDVARVVGKKSDYEVVIVDNVVQLVNKASATQSVLANSEYINFDDGSVIINVSNETQAVVARFYEIVLNRAADKTGIMDWLGEANAGKASSVDLANQFLNSQEFTSKHGAVDSLSDADFLELMYQKAFNRPGEAAGVEGWIAQMDAGMSRAEVVVRFALTSEIEAAFDGSINIIKTLQ